MKQRFIFLILSVFISFEFFSADIIAKNGNVNWNNVNSWDLGRLPICSDNIIIPGNSVVTLDASVFLNKDETCDKTRLDIFGKLIFLGGKKIALSKGAKVNYYKNAEIQSSVQDKGKSESIEIDKTIFWQGSDNIKKGEKIYNVNSKIEDYTKKSKQYFTINAQEGGVITTANGTVYNIKPNSLTNEKGVLISGNVEVEIIEIKNKSEMILNHKATMGLLANGKMSPLVSGGENYLKISQNNNELLPKEGIEVTVKSQKVDEDMEMFNGEINEKNQINWTQTNTKPKINADSYTYIQRRLGWCNIDKFYEDTRPNTEIFVKLPKEYDINNAIVYVSFDGNENLLAELSQFQNGLFTNRNAFSPIGAKIHVIAVSNSGNEWLCSVKATTIEEKMIIEMNDLLPNSEETMLTILKNIP
ncbi:MAG: hypothetical protein V4622_01135 [Bacteroidota bacterium]